MTGHEAPLGKFGVHGVDMGEFNDMRMTVGFEVKVSSIIISRNVSCCLAGEMGTRNIVFLKYKI